jgi:hypothetical protein
MSVNPLPNLDVVSNYRNRIRFKGKPEVEYLVALSL